MYIKHIVTPTNTVLFMLLMHIMKLFEKCCIYQLYTYYIIKRFREYFKAYPGLFNTYFVVFLEHTNEKSGLYSH